MFRAEPLYGVGAGNFNVVYRRYNVPQFIFSRGHAHNYYIHAAAETGIIGLVAYALVLVAAWVDIGRALRRLRDGWLRALTVGAAGILAAVMTHNLVENLHVLNMNLHFFAVLALPALALRVASSEFRVPSEATALTLGTRNSELGTGGRCDDSGDGRGGLHRQPPDAGATGAGRAGRVPG